jgi:hypothetical protein
MFALAKLLHHKDTGTKIVRRQDMTGIPRELVDKVYGNAFVRRGRSQ